jgi:hypothetical protein
MPLEFVALTSAFVERIALWFEDPDTQRYLGGFELKSVLDLGRDAPGTEFRDSRILARHSWVIFELNVGPVAYAGIEIYADGNASWRSSSIRHSGGAASHVGF